jgi:hypothetical protein
MERDEAALLAGRSLVKDATADYYRRLDEAHWKLDQEQRNKMVVIAGVGYRTLFRLAYEPGFLGLWEKTGKIFDRVRNCPGSLAFIFYKII